MSEIRPFKISVPQADLDDLKERLKRTRWANELSDAGDDYGLTVKYVKQLVEYWRDKYDWRRVEAELNQYPQFTTQIDGQTIHFVHVTSNQPNAVPIILTHGWPATFAEYTPIIDNLTNPLNHGGKADDAFNVVIPSLPGFAFSIPLTQKGWNRYRTAKAWAELMKRLGYNRYIAAGNDIGSWVSPEMGRFDPHHVMGVHVTQIFSLPSEIPKNSKR